MKTLKYTSQNKDIDVEYLTDLIGSNDSLTIYQVSQYVDEVKQVGLNGTAIVFGMPDDIEASNLTTMKALATDNNLTLQVLESGQSTITLNTLTDLAITTEAIDAGVAGAAQAETVTIPTVAEAQIEVLTVPTTGAFQVETVTFPATAGATQADYFVIENVAGADFAVWLDIDSDGTAPSGDIYTATTNKIEVNIATEGTAAANAAAAKTAIELNINWAGITITDNEDGTLTFTQNTVGDVVDVVKKNADDTSEGSFTSVLDTNGVANAVTQADYFTIVNVDGTIFAAWLDLDANGTEPTGAIYTAADVKIEVNVTSGNTAITNAAAVKAAIEANENWDGITITNNLDGTLTLTQDSKGAVDNIIVKSADDSGAGSFSASTTNEGVSGVEQGDYVVLKNALSQETVAVWMNVDSDDTEPTGAIYLASDYQVKVDVATGATSATNATAFADALDLETDWSGEVTIVDNENGTVTITQDYSGVVTAAVKKNADDSGVGAITSTTGTAGTAGTVYEFEFDAEGGNSPYIWTTESTLPEGISLSTEGVLSGTPRETGTFTLTITVTDKFGIEAELADEDYVVSVS